jgi:biotin carboxyl carrier protein
MNSKFKVKINNNFDFEISEQDLSQLDAFQISDTTYHILQEHQSFQTEIIHSNFNSKSYQIKVNNTNHSVKISNELDQLIDTMGFAVGATKIINNIKAPMPGLILEISVSIKQEVKENDPLLILEAMKMENIITSPRDGIIKSIMVKQGDAVEKNYLLIEFE